MRRRSRPRAASSAREDCSPCSQKEPGSAIAKRSGSPRRGAGRLALETGAPLVPAAITGTERLFLGPMPKPKRVQVAFGEPIAVRALDATPEAAGRLIDEELWPEVTAEYRRLLARPGVIAAGLAAAGVTALIAGRARRRRR